MLSEQKQKLLSAGGKYVSIGITEDGSPHAFITIPWERTAHAFAMKTPSLYLTPEDLQDEEILSLLDECHVVGCYIWASLRDYQFITRFPELHDLNIMQGENLANLDFLRSLHECRLLYLCHARLENLDAVLDAKKTNSVPWPVYSCVGLYDCTVEDVSRFDMEAHSFSEFLVWYKQDRHPSDRFASIRANTKRYFLIRDNDGMNEE